MDADFVLPFMTQVYLSYVAITPDMWRTAFSSFDPPHARPVTVRSRGTATACVTLETREGERGFSPSFWRVQAYLSVVFVIVLLVHIECIF